MTTNEELIRVSNELIEQAAAIQLKLERKVHRDMVRSKLHGKRPKLRSTGIAIRKW